MKRHRVKVDPISTRSSSCETAKRRLGERRWRAPRPRKFASYTSLLAPAASSPHRHTSSVRKIQVFWERTFYVYVVCRGQKKRARRKQIRYVGFDDYPSTVGFYNERDIRTRHSSAKNSRLADRLMIDSNQDRHSYNNLLAEFALRLN